MAPGGNFDSLSHSSFQSTCAHAACIAASSCQLPNMSESVEGVMLMLDAPLAQNFPEFLEILVPQCHPSKKNKIKQVTNQKLDTPKQDAWLILVEQVEPTHRLSFQSFVSLRPRQSHSTFKASFSWRSTLATKTRFTLNILTNHQTNLVLLN